jgi:hypothetical protein
MWRENILTSFYNIDSVALMSWRYSHLVLDTTEMILNPSLYQSPKPRNLSTTPTNTGLDNFRTGYLEKYGLWFVLLLYYPFFYIDVKN